MGVIANTSCNDTVSFLDTKENHTNPLAREKRSDFLAAAQQRAKRAERSGSWGQNEATEVAIQPVAPFVISLT